MKRLEDIKLIVPLKKKKDRISKNFEKVWEKIRRYNPPIYPSVNPVEPYRSDNSNYDDAA